MNELEEKIFCREVEYDKRTFYQVLNLNKQNRPTNLRIIEKVGFYQYQVVKFEKDPHLRAILLDIPEPFILVMPHVEKKIRFFFSAHQERVLLEAKDLIGDDGVEIDSTVICGDQLLIINRPTTFIREVVLPVKHRNEKIKREGLERTMERLKSHLLLNKSLYSGYCFWMIGEIILFSFIDLEDMHFGEINQDATEQSKEELINKIKCNKKEDHIK